MIRQSLVVLTSSIAALAVAAEVDPSAKQLQVYPKNLARQHLGANLFIFNQGSQTYSTTEAAAAWLDDDVTTGWPALAGKQHYLMALPEPEVVTNFALSTKSGGGTVTIYGGDEPAVPESKSWVPLVRDVSVEAVNQKKLGRPFNRLAKYILIETNMPDPGPIFSLYLFGDRPATSYSLSKRDQPIDTKAIFGPYVNDQTAFSHAGLYSGGRVSFSTDKSSYTGWQKAIDDNPESSVFLAATTDEAGMVLSLSGQHTVARMAVLTDGNAKGKLDVFLVPELSPTPAIVESGTEPAVRTESASGPVTHRVSLAGMTPTTTLEFDGSVSRLSSDFAATNAGAVLLRWTPDSAGQPLVVREVNTFNGYSLANYALTMTPEAVAELASDASKDGKAFADGKEGKDAKGLEPVGELFNRRTPYLPPSLGFPPPLPPRIPPPVSQ